MQPKSLYRGAETCVVFSIEEEEARKADGFVEHKPGSGVKQESPAVTAPAAHKEDKPEGKGLAQAHPAGEVSHLKEKAAPPAEESAHPKKTKGE